MEYYTAMEAARLLGHTERTIRQWLKAGRFPHARKTEHGIRRWLIPTSDIEEVKRLETVDSGFNRQEPFLVPEVFSAEKLAAIQQHVKAVEQRVESAEQAIEEMRQALSELAASANMPAIGSKMAEILETTQDTMPTPETPPASEWTGPDGISDVPLQSAPQSSLLTLRQLAKELQIARSTLLGHVLNEKNNLTHLAIPKGLREGEYERYFNAEQAEAVRVWHRKHTKGKK